MGGFIDDTAQRNSCSLLDWSVHIVSWIVLDLFLLHHPWACTVRQSTLLRFLRKESKIDGGVSVAVNMHSLIVSESDQ